MAGANWGLTPTSLLVVRQAVPHVEERLLVHRLVLERGVEALDRQVVVGQRREHGLVARAREVAHLVA